MGERGEILARGYGSSAGAGVSEVKSLNGTMKKILFVDDDRNVLEGLRRLLHSKSNDWQMQFALEAMAACDLLTKTTFDVVVSDMGMPRMNGVEFLSEVSRVQPSAVRMILSGQADEQAIAKSIGITHQFLAKPCDSKTLINTIERALVLRGYTGNDNIKGLLGSLESVPSCPVLYTQIVEEMRSSEVSLKKIGDIISHDPGMSVKVLKLVNSAFFGLKRTVTRPADAVAYLGVETIRNLVLAVAAFEGLKNPKNDASSANETWEHSWETARLAKKIIEFEGADSNTAEIAFTAGLLHDLGIILLESLIPQQSKQIIETMQTHRLPRWRVESELLGYTHADVAGYLLTLWGLPDSVVEPVVYHHQPAKLGETKITAVLAVHAAAALERDSDINGGGHPSELDGAYITTLGLAEHLKNWRKMAFAGAGA